MADTEYTITIRAEGAAFADDHLGELVLVLTRLTRAIAEGRLPDTLLDTNGNTVGTVVLVTTPEPEPRISEVERQEQQLRGASS